MTSMKSTVAALLLTSVVWAVNPASDGSVRQARAADGNHLEVTQSSKNGSSLRVKFHRRYERDDVLVLLYVDPRSTKTAAEMFKMVPKALFKLPKAEADEAANDVKHARKSLGNVPWGTIGSLECLEYGNLYCKETLAKTIGVSISASVTDSASPKGAGNLGTCAVYFNISDWRGPQEGNAEIPLPPLVPAGPSGGMMEQIPKNCRLSLLLVDSVGKVRAYGLVDVRQE